MAQSLFVRGYLIVYNLASFFGWALILSTTIKHLVLGPQTHSAPQRFAAEALAALRPFRAWFQEKYVAHPYLPDFFVEVLERASVLHRHVGALVALVQSAAVLEVVHAALGWVRSPVPTTVIQVASRLWLVWGISERYNESAGSAFYASMVFAWSLTECVRYSFYANSLMGSENDGLLWARYTLFYILYPLGAGSEAMLMFQTLPKVLPWSDPSAWSLSNYAILFLFVIWWPGLYVMYSHMIRQRSRALGRGFWGSKRTEEKKKAALLKEARRRGAKDIAEGSWATGEAGSKKDK